MNLKLIQNKMLIYIFPVVHSVRREGWEKLTTELREVCYFMID